MASHPVSPGLHALFDYALVALLLVAPRLLGLGGAITGIAWALGLGHLALTLFTDFPRSLARVVPFWAHGVVEASAASFLVFMGLLTAPASGAVLAVGGVILVVASLTDYHAADRAAEGAGERPELHGAAHAPAAAHPPRRWRGWRHGWRRHALQPRPSRR